MRYDVTYWTPKGLRLASFDADVTDKYVGQLVPGPDVAHVMNTDGDRHDFWVWQDGSVHDGPPWDLRGDRPLAGHPDANKGHAG